MSDPRLVWAIFFVTVALVTGAYYEALSVRDTAAHKACVTVNDGRVNLNRRSTALSDYITIVLRLNSRAEKIQPPPDGLRRLEAEEVTAIKRLRSEQRPLPLVSCP